jgi:Kef-type K+ transport system membrane component KefB
MYINICVYTLIYQLMNHPSMFVDKNAMSTRYGKASFGILLLQDLAVVPVLVVVELLSAGGAGLGKALAIAGTC